MTPLKRQLKPELCYYFVILFQMVKAASVEYWIFGQRSQES